MDEARQVRDFWFGRQPMTPAALEERMRFWFGDGSSGELQARRDEEIRTRFGALMERAARGELDSWESGPRRRLSLIILLDQFPRNAYRGTARAFATDTRALQLALSGMQVGADAALEPVERLFFYMPLQHAELLEVQDEAVAAFRRLADEVPDELRKSFVESVRYAELHRDIIARFGRFPHRNRVLGRESTAAEEEFLRQGADRFGQ